MTEVKIEASDPLCTFGWDVQWLTQITVGDKYIEVVCWTHTGRVEGQWRQPTTRDDGSGLPRIRSIRINRGTINVDEIDDVVNVDVEIGSDSCQSKTMTLSLRELRALMAHADADGYLDVEPPDCNEAACEELLLEEARRRGPEVAEVRIEAGVPYQTTGWRVRDNGGVAGYVHWPTRIYVEDACVEVDCWTRVGRAFGHADLDGSPLDPGCRGQWRQLPTDGSESGMPRVRSIRIAGETLDIGDDIDDVADVAIEIGAGHAGPCETLTTSLRGLRALAEFINEFGDLDVIPPDCNEAVCESLPRDDD